MERILICVDYQYDFVAEDGKLTCGEPAQAIYSKLLGRVREYLNNGGSVLFTHDSHDADKWQDHPESKAYPLHCEAGTRGYRLYGELDEIEKNSASTITVDKKAYCMDFGKLSEIVKEYGEIEICGVTTDICVLQNAVGLYTAAVNCQTSPKFFLNAGCCASFNAEGHRFAIEYMNRILGFEII